MPSSKYVKDFEAVDPFPYPNSGDIFESLFMPTGLVPYPCAHGLAELPADHPQFHRFPNYSKAGGELPRFGGKSWGRSKYLTITYFGGRTEKLPGGQEVTVAAATVKCVRCLDPNNQTDVTEWASGR